MSIRSRRNDDIIKCAHLSTLLLNNRVRAHFQRSYANSLNYNKDGIQLTTNPFKVITLLDLIHDHDYWQLLSAEFGDAYFSRKSNDLFTLHQTDDFAQLQDKPALLKLRDLLLHQLRPLISEIMGVELDENKISMNCSIYLPHNYLLCHDDKTEDRKVAFVLYANDKWSEKEDGGSFDMFGHDDLGEPTAILRSIFPLKNMFICFEVGDFSYHQVAEVMSNRRRYSVNGWFHAKSMVTPQQPLPFVDCMPQTKRVIELDDASLESTSSLFDLSMIDVENVKEIQHLFRVDEYISISNMVIRSNYNHCCKLLKAKSIEWRKRLPPNRRCYDVAQRDSLPKTIKKIMKFFESSQFAFILQEVTGIPLTFVKESGSEFAEVVCELQRWKRGCYTLVTENEAYMNKAGLDVYLFFCREKFSFETGGFIVYCDTGSSKPRCLVEPTSNCLAVVNRRGNHYKFTKYINSLVKETAQYYVIAATYYQPMDC